MKIRSLPMIVALVAAALPLLTLGEASEPSTAAAASAPVAGPRLPTAAEQRDNAATPDLRVERSTTPQIIIPLGRKTDTPRVSRTAATRGAAAASAGGIDDAAARCEAQTSAPLRATCRRQLAHQTRLH